MTHKQQFSISPFRISLLNNCFGARLNIFLLFALFSCCSLLYSQTKIPSTDKKPKIGLVLSGGGAKGFAHIGVLKVIEEAGIKVDYIGGTSMGAVIGGLYASGYNAAQIDSIFQKTNFDDLINDYIPRASKNFYEKRNDALYAITLPFSQMRIGIPQALSKGIYNYNLLSSLTRNVRHIQDFNNLPTPFLCIGTDIETGKQVLLNKGNLAQAIMASSSFPSLFSPVEIDGQLLVDGGVVNNYPIDEIKKLGADIIIGVDVQDDLLKRKNLKDATKILVQITNLQSIEKMKRKIGDTDIYIKPDIRDYGVVSFDKGEEIIRKGEEASFVVYEKLKALVKPDDFYTKPPLKVASDTLEIKDINYSKIEGYTKEYITGKLRFKANSTISYLDLQTGINNLNATDNFSVISYSLSKNEEKDDLNLTLVENPTQTFLKFGLHYDGLYKSGLLLNITRKKTFLKNDNLSFDVVLGDNFRYTFDYYIENGFNISWGFQSKLSRFNRNITPNISSVLNYDNDDNLINTDYLDVTNRAYFQSLFLNKILIGGGAEFQYLNISSQTINSVDSNIDKSNYFSLFGYAVFDSYNKKNFPSKGWFFSGDFQTYLASSNYTGQFNPFSIAKGKIGGAFTFFKKLSLHIESEAGFAIGKQSVPFFNFALGGYGYAPTNNFNYFYGYDFISLAADSYIKSVITLDYEFLRKNHVNFSANYANIKDNLFDSVEWISLPDYSGYAVGYGLESRIGPIEIKYTWSPELSKGYTWFKIGYEF
ncbi:patatin-like phospholipase family protein [Flavobacterium agrisoli]|uniref:Patatin-like phospholipase family protein n=1 Tax=Flavobacterium agrisoli TaxID=2793066 RepID=A0A934PMI7_9FLAO|nr:patatin-like phospholipase family protein [Flavobacterium agrisoli]MBK0369575.1 patatin-like phospholipase family protein [Flavobacterium agrisoli]